MDTFFVLSSEDTERMGSAALAYLEAVKRILDHQRPAGWHEQAFRAAYAPRILVSMMCDGEAENDVNVIAATGRGLGDLLALAGDQGPAIANLLIENMRGAMASAAVLNNPMGEA